MKDGFIRVGCSSFELQLANISYNTQQIIKQITIASDQHVHVLLFPELSLCGASIQDLLFQKPLLNSIYEHIPSIVNSTVDKNMFVVIGAPLYHLDHLYNCAIVIYNGKILGVVPQTYLSSSESRYFTPALDDTTEITINHETYPFGTDLIFYDPMHPHLKIAIEIGHDMTAPIPYSSYHCLNGATLILNPQAQIDMTSHLDYTKTMLSSLSRRSICAYAYCNSGLGESSTDVVYHNHHMIYENGTLLSEGQSYQDGLISADVDLSKIQTQRLESIYPTRKDQYTYIPFSLQDETLELNRYYEPYPFALSNPSLREKRCQEVLEIQIQGLIQRLKATHTKKVVVGISGGLDSTLALLVCHLAFERLKYPVSNIIAVTMPCFGTTSRTKNNALDMMNELHVTSLTVNIKDAVMQHFNDIHHDINTHDVTFENAQARERTQVLMDIANKEGALVIGTGDLSEVALGWSTYNGDHMSMYAVNCDVAKTLIRHIVEYIANMHKDTALSKTLKDILDTPVSPELLPAKDNDIVQKTEDIVGPYELHDFFLYHHVKYHYEPAKLLRIAQLAFKNQYDKETLIKWLTLFYRRFFTQQFKRSCIPDGPKVGSVALSPRTDLKLPSDINIQLWMDLCQQLTDED